MTIRTAPGSIPWPSLVTLKLLKALRCLLKRLWRSLMLGSWNQGCSGKAPIGNVHSHKQAIKGFRAQLRQGELLFIRLFSDLVRPPWASALFSRDAWSGPLDTVQIGWLPRVGRVSSSAGGRAAEPKSISLRCRCFNYSRAKPFYSPLTSLIVQSHRRTTDSHTNGDSLYSCHPC